MLDFKLVVIQIHNCILFQKLTLSKWAWTLLAASSTCCSRSGRYTWDETRHSQRQNKGSTSRYDGFHTGSEYDKATANGLCHDDGGQGSRYETGDAGGVLIGGKLGKPGNITQLVREPCIGGEILGHIQAAAQLSQVQYQTQQLYMPSPCQLTCATERHGGQGQDGPGVRDQPAENWDGLPRGGESWSNS